jgi:hypothetical protein
MPACGSPYNPTLPPLVGRQTRPDGGGCISLTLVCLDVWACLFVHLLLSAAHVSKQLVSAAHVSQHAEP